MAGRQLSIAVIFLFALGTGCVLAQQAAAPLGPLGVPVGATGGLEDGPDLYGKNCQGCHGTDLSGGRGPSLFGAALLAERSDDELHQTILNGTANGMPAFKGQLDDMQIGRMLAYLRIRSGAMASNPPPVPDPSNLVIKSEKQTFRIDVVASGIDTPWGEAFLPDGRLLVTERSSHIRIIDAKGKLQPDPVKNTPVAWVRQDGGYFDIAVNPAERTNPWIYLSYSEVQPGYAGPLPPPGPVANGAVLPPSMTRIVRGHINARGEWVDQQDIFKAPAALYTPSTIHFGSRFLFDGKGHLFYTLGDRGDMTNAQRLDSPLGKIHRVNLDGSAPADNPFVGRAGAIATIWSYGNRNPEGLSYDPVTGLLWESEHGPTGGDEVNIIEKGHDYGWGVVSMGLQPGITGQHQAGMDDPITYYSPSIGPSGISFNTGSRYAGWKNNLFLAALVGQKLYRYEIDGRRIAHQEVLWNQYGRTRAVIMGPDGLLYVLLQNATGSASTAAATPGMVVRLVPVNN